MAKFIQIKTQPYLDQEPGTSGLRKPTKTFLQSNYTENFVQSILNICVLPEFKSEQCNTLVCGGDGRYFVKDCLKKVIIPLCFANGVNRLIIGIDGLVSTPCASFMIRSNQCIGGILLTASHNPGGIDADFGIKYNCQNGGPAPEKVTDKIFQATKSISEYRSVEGTIEVDLSKTGTTYLNVDNQKMQIDVVDTSLEYSKYLQTIFDFDPIKCLITSDKFKCLITGLNGVMGPYIKQIFCNDLGMPQSSAIQCEPMDDFGGHHPDPNLTYARSLVKSLEDDLSYSFGAAFDGDGDRNMILGKGGYFICPCDLLALIVDNIDCIKYFDCRKVQGMARSMPTSRALDEVCKAKQLQCYETPTGWKYFGNLMDHGLCSVCGEESFGHGSDHIREKDGIWAVLAILSLLARNYKTGKPIDLEEIALDHWSKYGRYFFTRYDYENCSVEEGKEMMSKLTDFIKNPSNLDKDFGSSKIIKMDDFGYTDPTDESITTKKGIRIFLNNGARLVYRLSGTGSNGATLRMYIDKHEKDLSTFRMQSSEYLKETISLAVEICGVAKITGRTRPTVIT